ncbi:MAG: hypothetical protein Q7R83_01105 [bacterium]|nr:hypothetical protein [bacterium]
MLALLTRFDKAVHDRVMNPAFRFLESLFHCNRFQLIRIVSVMNIALLCLLKAIQALTGYVAIPDTTLTLIILAIGGSIVWHWRNLGRASEAFEDGTSDPLPPTLRSRREIIRFVRPIFSALIVPLVASFLFLVLKRAPIGDTTVLTTLCALIVFVEVHLWDADDLAPRDRLHLFKTKQRIS